MPGPRPYVGLTKLPDPLPKDAVVAKKDCGCYLVLTPNDPPVTEFVCAHGFFVGEDSVS